MSDRVNGFVVTLEHDLRDDDAEGLRLAILQLRGVLNVDANVVKPSDHIARQQVRADLERRLFDALGCSRECVRLWAPE